MLRGIRIAYARHVVDSEPDTAAAALEQHRVRVAPIAFVVAYLGCYLLGIALVPFLGGVTPTAAAWVNLAIPVVFAIIGCWVFRDAWLRSFRLSAARPWATFGLFVAGVVAILVVPVVVGLVVVLAGGAPTGLNQAQLVSALGGADTRWLIAIAAVVFGPIIEELVFREALAWRLQRRLPAWLLIVGSSLLFGLWHLKDVADLASVAVYASMGLVLAGVMWLTRGNLVAAVTTHAARNLVSLVLLLSIA